MSDNTTHIDLDAFSTLVNNPATVSLNTVDDMVPVTGAGSPILPATYAADKDRPRDLPAGPAFTEDTPHLISDPTALGGVRPVLENEITDTGSGRVVRGRSVVVDSVGSHATRAENALWALSANAHKSDAENDDAPFTLPGILLLSRDDIRARIENVASTKNFQYANQIKALTDDEREALFDSVAAAVNLDGTRASSWTLAHRHVDAVLRTGIDPVTGKDLTPTGGANPTLADRIAGAGSGHLADLLNFSPNSVLYGYWNASKNAVRHSMARSTSGTVTGYGVTRCDTRATRTQPWYADKEMTFDTAKDNMSYAKKGGSVKAPSELGLSTIPSTNDKMVTCESILSVSQVSTAHLRRLLANSDVKTTRGQAGVDAATTALTALALLGDALVRADGFYRSSCDLVATGTNLSVVSRDPDIRHAWDPAVTGDLRNITGLTDLVARSIDAAREFDLFLPEQPEVIMNDTAAGIFISSHLKAALTKEGLDEGEAK